MLLFSSDLPNPADTDIGKLVVSIGFLLVIAEHAVTLFGWLTGRKSSHGNEHEHPPEAKPLTLEFVTKTDFTEHRNEIKGRLDTMQTTFGQYVTRVELQRLEGEVRTISAEHKQFAGVVQARHEQLTNQLNEMKVSQEAARSEMKVSQEATRRELGDALHKIAADITAKIETVDRQNWERLVQLLENSPRKKST